MTGGTHVFEKCSNCGGEVETSPDGRAVHCPYCQSKTSKEVDPTHLAASLQTELKNIEVFFVHIAERLTAAFPEHARSETDGGFFSEKKLSLLEVTLDPYVYRMRRDGTRIVAERVKMVRGIALKTERMTPPAWLKGLSEGLAAMANASAEAHDALARVMRGG